jgi:hypothetical protein
MCIPILTIDNEERDLTFVVSWTRVEDFLYELEERPSDGFWLGIYYGNNTKIERHNLDPGEYEYRVRCVDDPQMVEWVGEWSDVCKTQIKHRV